MGASRKPHRGPGLEKAGKANQSAVVAPETNGDDALREQVRATLAGHNLTMPMERFTDIVDGVHSIYLRELSRLRTIERLHMRSQGRDHL